MKCRGCGALSYQIPMAMCDSCKLSMDICIRCKYRGIRGNITDSICNRCDSNNRRRQNRMTSNQHTNNRSKHKLPKCFCGSVMYDSKIVTLDFMPCNNCGQLLPNGHIAYKCRNKEIHQQLIVICFDCVTNNNDKSESNHGMLFLCL